MCSGSHIPPVHPGRFFFPRSQLARSPPRKVEQLVRLGCGCGSCWAHGSSGTDSGRSDLLPGSLKMLQSFKVHVRNPSLMWPLNVAINEFSAAAVFNRKACLPGCARLSLLSGLSWETRGSAGLYRRLLFLFCSIKSCLRR